MIGSGALGTFNPDNFQFRHAGLTRLGYEGAVFSELHRIAGFLEAANSPRKTIG